MGSSRRFFLQLLGALGLVATTTETTGCAPGEEDDSESDENAITLTGYDYIVVGSGAGGGPLAANLARAGNKVLLLEAGDDQGANPNYQVPAFHAKSSDDELMRWDFFVKHYKDEARAKKDKKFTWETPDGKYHVGPNAPAGSKPLGILYPRAGTLGGCTSHNAMITVYPHESDWQKIANIFPEDASWKPDNMRRYYQLLERCEYLGSGDEQRGHGFRGWLGVNRADARLGLRDLKLLQVVKAAAMTVGGLFGSVEELIGTMRRDLNAQGPARDAKEGLYAIPLATTKGKRNGPREYILDTVAKGFPLDINMRDGIGCLATRVNFGPAGPDGKRRATGVDFIKGKSQYRADPRAKNAQEGSEHTAKLKPTGEVILAAGAYNTPQLLKLSGIGPKDELDRFNIPVKVDLKGVGTNLQDRYEVGVVSEVKDNFALVGNCTFGAAGDPCLEDWRRNGQATAYASNGIAVAVVKKSSVSRGDPDLFVFGGPANFTGYYPQYSKDTVKDKKHFTWAVLKAHTENKAGTVTLKSADPRDMPEINFNYFDTGTGGGAADRDLQAVVEGVKLARSIGHTTGNLMLDDIPLLGGKFEEQTPGPEYADDANLKEFVKNEAWGHHASCTCPMGNDGDEMAVLDGEFNVRGTKGLRVVDASVFPSIPGFFIVVPIYMMSEKATDVVLKDALDPARANGETSRATKIEAFLATRERV